MMSTQAPDAPLRAVAHVLSAAKQLGSSLWNGKAMSSEDQPSSEAELSQDLLDLFQLLNQRKMKYLLVGGVALLKYVAARNTEDIDLVLSLESLRQMPEITVADQNRDFARGRFHKLRVDVLLAENPLFTIVNERHATTHRFNEIDVRCATVEGLLLLKLYALPWLYRQGDGQRIALYEADIMMLCQRYKPPMEPIFTVLAPLVAPGELQELRNIVSDIQRRIARIENGPNAQPKP